MGGGVGAMESLGIRHAMFSEGVSLPDEFSGTILLPVDVLRKVLVAGKVLLLGDAWGSFRC